MPIKLTQFFIQVKLSNFPQDQFARTFGVSVNNELVKVTARILKVPCIIYGQVSSLNLYLLVYATVSESIKSNKSIV